MRSKAQRKFKRNFNKTIFDINKHIQEREDLRNKFAIEQVYFNIRDYEDKSGFYFDACLRLIDKKTKDEEIIWIDSKFGYKIQILIEFSKFINKQMGV